jgi:hypothetical protein
MVVPVVTPVIASDFYDHLRRSWDNSSRKHNKRNSSHQQPRQFSFHKRPTRHFLDGWMHSVPLQL